MDSSKPELLANQGKYCDTIHYTAGWSAETSTARPIPYLNHWIGIYIFVRGGETILTNKDELAKIYKAFLPVFVEAQIVIVEGPFLETCPCQVFADEYWYQVAILDVEKFDRLAYSYSDDVPDWQWLDSYGPDHQNGRSYRLDDPLTHTFRTYHSHFSYRRDERKWYDYPD